MWKTSDKSIVNEINVLPFEEIDLLGKWLGPTPSKSASSNSASNVNGPEKEIQRIWERLHDRDGRYEMVEATIKDKFDNFRKLSNKEINIFLWFIGHFVRVGIYNIWCTLFTIVVIFWHFVRDQSYCRQITLRSTRKMDNSLINLQKQYKVPLPPLSLFIDFIRDMSEMKMI